jgi:hypothetical protein
MLSKKSVYRTVSDNLPDVILVFPLTPYQHISDSPNRLLPETVQKKTRRSILRQHGIISELFVIFTCAAVVRQRQPARSSPRTLSAAKRTRTGQTEPTA